MKKLLLVLLFVPLVSCSSGDDNNDINNVELLNENGEPVIKILDFDFENILVLLKIDDIIGGFPLKKSIEGVVEIDLGSVYVRNNSTYQKYIKEIKEKKTPLKLIIGAFMKTTKIKQQLFLLKLYLMCDYA